MSKVWWLRWSWGDFDISFKRPGWELAKNLLPPQGLGWTQGVKDLRNSARVSKAQTSLGSASKAVKQSPAPQGRPRATRPHGIQQRDARSGQALRATARLPSLSLVTGKFDNVDVKPKPQT